MTWGLLTVLLAGCAKPIPTNNACDVLSPLLFDTKATIDWLNQNDQQLLRAVVAHNETYAALCR